MVRWFSAVTVSILLAGPGPAPLAAQSTRTCLVQLDSVGGTGRSVEIGPGTFHQFGGGGVWARCRGESTRMRSDSVAWYSDRDRVDLVGSVVFHDVTVDLFAKRASYFLKDERLEAYGGVRLVNRETGSELTGPTLTYYREVAGLRDTSELFATNRPTVHYRSEKDGPEQEPYVIVGDRVRLKGNSGAWMGGSVTVDRSDFAARADSSTLDLEAGSGAFLGHAEVRGGDAAAYTLSGRRIDFRLADRKLRWVQARGLADATSAEWRLVADTLEFEVRDQRIQSGLAWGDSTRPRALSQTYTITADSLALDAPDQELREIRGFANTLATAKTDSLALEADWMAGDSLSARFEALPTGQQVLTVLEARGSARAYYRITDPAQPGPPGINYSRGKRITARFRLDGVDRIDVVGGADGVYLEPTGEPKP